MKSVLDVTLPVFALVFCGWLAATRNLMPASAIAGINAFVFWFALPAMLFRVVAQRSLAELFEWRFAAGYVLATAVAYGVAYRAARAGWVAPGKTDSAYSTILALHVTHGNVGYLGIALVAQLSALALPTVALVITCDILVAVTLSIMLLERARAQQTSDTRSPWPAVMRSLFRSPLVLSIAAGLVASAVALPMPKAADNFLSMLAGAAGPGALFAIGATLGAQRLSFDREIALLVTTKLVAMPLLVALALFVLFRPDPYAAAVGVVCAALPAATNPYIIAQRYGVPTEAISGAIAVSTIASVFTVSLAIWWLGLA